MCMATPTLLDVSSLTGGLALEPDGGPDFISSVILEIAREMMQL